MVNAEEGKYNPLLLSSSIHPNTTVHINMRECTDLHTSGHLEGGHPDGLATLRERFLHAQQLMAQQNPLS